MRYATDLVRFKAAPTLGCEFMQRDDIIRGLIKGIMCSKTE